MKDFDLAIRILEVVKRHKTPSPDLVVEIDSSSYWKDKVSALQEVWNSPEEYVSPYKIDGRGRYTDEKLTEPEWDQKKAEFQQLFDAKIQEKIGELREMTSLQKQEVLETCEKEAVKAADARFKMTHREDPSAPGEFIRREAPRERESAHVDDLDAYWANHLGISIEELESMYLGLQRAPELALIPLFSGEGAISRISCWPDGVAVRISTDRPQFQGISAEDQALVDECWRQTVESIDSRRNGVNNPRYKEEIISIVKQYQLEVDYIVIPQELRDFLAEFGFADSGYLSPFSFDKLHEIFFHEKFSDLNECWKRHITETYLRGVPRIGLKEILFHPSFYSLGEGCIYDFIHCYLNNYLTFDNLKEFLAHPRFFEQPEWLSLVEEQNWVGLDFSDSKTEELQDLIRDPQLARWPDKAAEKVVLAYFKVVLNIDDFVELDAIVRSLGNKEAVLEALNNIASNSPAISRNAILRIIRKGNFSTLELEELLRDSKMQVNSSIVDVIRMEILYLS